jgi:hypothetical protein
MLPPSSGTAFINGHDILTDMPAIRKDLGICPQFDILWPDLTCREHLHMCGADGARAHAHACGPPSWLQATGVVVGWGGGWLRVQGCQRGGVGWGA